MNKANHEVSQARAPAALVNAATLPQVGRVAALPANDTLRPIERVGMIGADGTAIAIAMDLLDADMPVTLFDSRRESTIQAVALARCHYEKLAGAGQLCADKRDRRMALLTGAANFHHLKDCDLIFIMQSSDMQATEKLFARLDDTVRQGTILVSNHAAAGIDRLARCTRRPGVVVGLRLSNPANPLGSFDLVRGKETAEEAFATVDLLLRKIRNPSR